MICANWFLFIYALTTNQVLAIGLGYYINPIISVILGMIFFKERPRALQWPAIFLALLGILNYIYYLKEVPLISLSLAITLGLYGLMRKKIQAHSFSALMQESIILSVPFFALAYFTSPILTIHSLG